MKYLSKIIVPIILVISYFCFSNVAAQTITPKYIDSLIITANSFRNIYPEKVLEICNSAVELSDSINYNVGKVKALDQIGVQYKKIGAYDESLKYHLWALDYLDDNDESMLKAYILSNIANTYVYLFKYKEAEKLYFESLEIKKKFGDKKQIAYTYSKLGLLSAEVGDFDLARKYTEETYRLVTELNDTTEISNALSHRGFVEMKGGNFKKSISLLSDAKKIKLNLENHQYAIAETDIWIAHSFLGLKDYDKALEHIQLAEGIAKKQESKKLLLEIFYLTAKIYKMSNRLIEAYNYLFSADSLNHLLNSEYALSKVAQFSSLYSLNKKEVENAQLREENYNKQTEIAQSQFANKVLIIIVLLAFIVLVLLVFLVRISKKKNREIRKQSSDLEKLNKQFREANATKDKFFTIIAHDLKNPLNTLIGYTQMVTEDFETIEKDDMKEMLDAMRNASGTLSVMIESLLSWAQSQRDMIVLNKKKHNIDFLIDEVVSELTPTAKVKRIDITYTNEGIEFFTLDSSVFEMVLRNLLGNSIKFTPQDGKIEICVKDVNGSLLLSVKDNGIGIDKNDIYKLFKIGSKISKSGTNQETGTGLGLILCKEFVEKHGGHIWVENNSGAGAAFFVEIPA